MDSPCNKCLMIPLCRRKHYMSLISSCELLFTCLFGDGDTYLPNTNKLQTYNKMICKVEKEMKPLNWKVVRTIDGSKYKILGKAP